MESLISFKNSLSASAIITTSSFLLNSPLIRSFKSRSNARQRLWREERGDSIGGGNSASLDLRSRLHRVISLIRSGILLSALHEGERIPILYQLRKFNRQFFPQLKGADLIVERVVQLRPHAMLFKELNLIVPGVFLRCRILHGKIITVFEAMFRIFACNDRTPTAKGIGVGDHIGLCE